MFIIRDDDISAWTKADEIKGLYGDFLERGGKVCFAAIPDAFPAYNRGNRNIMYQGLEKKTIDNNKELIEYLKPYIMSNQVEIMQHGYDHGYFVEYNNDSFFLDEKVRELIGSSTDIKYIPECCAKQKEQLRRELSKGRTILEDSFGTKIKVFVPPSNGLTSDAAEVINDMGMNISGTVTSKLNRKKDIHLYMAVIKKLMWRTLYKDISYPKVMKYSNHLELTGHSFTPITDKVNFRRQLDFCNSRNYPFVLATHYWELLENENLKTDLNEIIYGQLTEKNILCMSEAFVEYEEK